MEVISTSIRRGPDGEVTQADRESVERTQRVDVPQEVLERNRVLRPDQFDDFAQSYSLIRTQLLQRLAASGFNSFAVVSPGAGEGKTLTALNIAVSIARSAQHTALVVDMDLRNPCVHRYLELEPRHGVVDVIRGDAGIPETLINPGIEDLKLLPGKSPAERPAELLASATAAGLTTELRNRYPDRVLVFDLPPLLHFDDALGFLPNVDAYLLVVDEGNTRREAIERTLKLLDGRVMLGSVLNRSRDALSGK